MRDLIAAEKFYGTKKKKIIILIAVVAILLAGLMAFPGDLAAPRSARLKREVQAHMKTFNILYQQKNVEGIMAIYSDDPGVVMLGNGPDEQHHGREAIEKAYGRLFSTAGELQSVESRIVSLTIEGDIAALAAERHISAVCSGEVVTDAEVLTAGLQRINGRWVFLQTHFSRKE